MSEGFSDEERKALQSLADVLEQFMLLRYNIPLHHLVLLLRMGLDEGHSQKYYSGKLGYPTASVSRAFLDLGKKTRKGAQGLMLTDDRPSMASLREHETFPSIKGRALLRRVADRLLAICE